MIVCHVFILYTTFVGRMSLSFFLELTLDFSVTSDFPIAIIRPKIFQLPESSLKSSFQWKFLIDFYNLKNQLLRKQTVYSFRFRCSLISNQFNSILTNYWTEKPKYKGLAILDFSSVPGKNSREKLCRNTVSMLERYI